MKISEIIDIVSNEVVHMCFQIMGGNNFKFEIHDCFGDFRICVLAYCVPCYVIGKNSEAVGEDCIVVGLVSIFACILAPIIRYRVREKKNLKGSMATDMLAYAVIPYCTLIQDAREIGWADASSEAMARS